MSDDLQIQSWYKKASDAYKDSDTSRWVAAEWCAKVVGKDVRGLTLGLADYMGVSSDTVYNLAHAYFIFDELCSVEAYRHATIVSRDSPRVFYSHFLALWTARNRYHLTLAEVFDILRDIVLDEGGISSRDVDGHIRQKFGRERDWIYYAESANKRLARLLECTDVPKELRELAKPVLTWIGDNINAVGDEYATDTLRK